MTFGGEKMTQFPWVLGENIMTFFALLLKNGKVTANVFGYPKFSGGKPIIQNIQTLDGGVYSTQVGIEPISFAAFVDRPIFLNPLDSYELKGKERVISLSIHNYLFLNGLHLIKGWVTN